MDYSKVAVLIPCYNEEMTVGPTVRDFARALPGAAIYVYDNRSTDQTAQRAKDAGAIVRHAPIQGKGAVVRQMFQEIDAEAYLMTDGDCTYSAEYATQLLALLDTNDMVLGDRLSGNYYKEQKRFGHGFGNSLVRFLVNFLFHGHVSDIMTGYRAFSRDFVKSVVLIRDGFEVETEMTIWALTHGHNIGSVGIQFTERPDGSVSKVNTVRDGIRILSFIMRKWWACR